jgi:hypothetical protein
VVVNFESGTTRQRALFQQAIDRSIFPWDRITTHVHVAFASVVPGGHHRFAATQWGIAPDLLDMDICGRPDEARVTILDDLDDPHRPGDDDGWPLGHWTGEDFFMETVIHELGHVVQSKFNDAQIAAMSAVFDGTPDDWAGDESTGKAWEDRRQESFAETFKDIYLPRPNRKYDCRTPRRLRSDRFESFLHVLDGICPCSTTNVIFDRGDLVGPSV